MITKPIHEGKTISVKTAHIDKLMIPIVKWLSAFNSVFTTHCCEEGGNREPYVTFITLDGSELAYITQETQGYVRVIESSFYNGVLRYTIRFPDQEYLLNFNKHLGSLVKGKSKE